MAIDITTSWNYNSAVMVANNDRKQLSILNVLRAYDKPVSSSKIAEELNDLGHEISERTVRFYLKQMDSEGLTQAFGKRGRKITELGLSELNSSRVIEKVGFFSARIDQMTYRMNFDLTNRIGTVVINATFVIAEQLKECVGMISRVFEKGFAMGHLLTILEPGERIGNLIVPPGRIGIGTVCSITLNSVLLKYGIPTNSRFGGLLDIQNSKPTRFVEIITYEGTSINPLEIFIRSGMTDYVGAVKTGNGRIGASFREFPAESRQIVEELALKLSAVGLGGFMSIGRAGRALLEIPVSEGRVGAIVIGGLNPVAILEETGVRVFSRAMAGLVDYNKLFHYSELESRVGTYL